LGRQIKDFANDPAEFESLIRSSETQGSAVRLELPFRHKSGRTIYCDVSLINLTNTKGQRVGTVGICRDITLWKQLNEDLIHVDRLAEMGRIASGMAHEINNPLAIIKEISGWAATVLSEAKGLSPEDREELETAVQRIEEQTRRCRTITHQLLGFVRDTAPRMASFNLNELVQKAIDFLKPELKHKPIEIVLDLDEKISTIHSDPKMLEQVLVNLITNSIHAISEKGLDDGRIELKTSMAGDRLGIAISDNGTGIPEKDQESIFDLFYTTKPPGKGTGLGLPICQNIIRKLEGDISLETRTGQGTTFTLRFPVS
jgi:two-component system NtrC family sensor kinase